MKRGHFISNWKSRWLVVSGGEISYYVDHSKTQLKKKVTLDSKCTAERMPPLAKQKFVFLVSFPNKWDLIVSVESDELRQKWIDYIRTEILMLYGGPPPEPPQNARAPSTAKQPQKPMTLARAKATKRPTSVDGPSGAALAAAMAAASASAGASAAAPPASPTSGSAAANGKVSPSQQQQQQDQEPLPPGWAQVILVAFLATPCCCLWLLLLHFKHMHRLMRTTFYVPLLPGHHGGWPDVLLPFHL